MLSTLKIGHKASIALISLSVFSSALWAEKGPAYRGALVDGQGRTGTASVMGTDAMFLNPAGQTGLTGNGFQVFGNMGVNGVLLDYAKWAGTNAKYINSIDSMLLKMEPVQNKWAPFSNAFGIQGHYQDFSIAVIEDVRYDLSLSKAVITPVPGVGVLSDFQVVAGRGFQLQPEWKVGFAVKYLYRLRYEDRLVGTTDDDFYTVKRVLQKPAKSFYDKLAKIKVAGDVADPGQGFGINLGAIRQLDKGFSVGASVLDFPTFYSGGFIYPQLNLGGAFAKDLDLLEGLKHRVVVNLDWQIPGDWEPMYKQWKFGTSLEGRLGDRVVSVVSLGINEGYPSFGLRAGYVLYLSYVYLAEETGSFPGQRKLAFHKLSLDFGF